MADDLRTRLEAALQPYCWYEFAPTGDVITLVDLDDVLDAVVPVVEYARDISSTGQCRRCHVFVDPDLIPPHWGKQAELHRMSCRWYVGSVEHYPATGAGEYWQACVCGADLEERGHSCPNVAETWRGSGRERWLPDRMSRREEVVKFDFTTNAEPPTDEMRRWSR